MPANIAVTDGKAHAVYAGKPAWHGLGTVVPEALTWGQAYKLAGLDYGLDLVPAYAKVGGRFVEVPERRAIVRKDTRAVFEFVSTDYRLIQNKEVGRVLDVLTHPKRGKAEAAYVAAGALGKGERVWAVLQLSLLKDIQIERDPSKVDAFLVAQTRHDGSGALTVMPSTIRRDCQNMLDAGEIQATREGKLVRIRHTGDVDAQLKDAREILGLAEKTVKEYIGTMNALAAIPADGKWLDGFLEKLIPIPQEMERPGSREEAREAIKGLYKGSRTLHGVPASAYRALQAITEYSDHVRPLRVVDRDRWAERRFTSLTTGPAHELKARAMELMRQEFEIGPKTAKVPVLAGRN